MRRASLREQIFSSVKTRFSTISSGLSVRMRVRIVECTKSTSSNCLCLISYYGVVRSTVQCTHSVYTVCSIFANEAFQGTVGLRFGLWRSIPTSWGLRSGEYHVTSLAIITGLTRDVVTCDANIHIR